MLIEMSYEKRRLDLQLTPHFDERGVESFTVQLRIEDAQYAAGQPMFIMNTFADNIPGPGYRESQIQAFDHEGLLRFAFSDIPTTTRNTQQHWSPMRSTKGDVTLSFHVPSREVNMKTPVGARIDVRRDGGGLQGVGKWFLPRLLSDDEWINTVYWNLPKDTPEGTRCIWSFGEGISPPPRSGQSDLLQDTVYMIGPVQSYPPQGEDSPRSEDNGNHASLYWFDTLPSILDRHKTFNTDLHPKMAKFFGVTNESYRVFYRRVPRVFGGTGFLSSYVLDYDEAVKEQPDSSVLGLLAHEMVHSFVHMDAEEDDYDNAWFTEGIAELYSATLPYRFGLCGLDYCIDMINSNVVTYFTSPRIGMDIKQAVTDWASDWYAVWIPYKRGAAYLSILDCLLRRKAGNFDLLTNSRLDDIVIDIAKRNRAGILVRGQDWIKYLDKEFIGIDYSVEARYHGMLRGEILSFENTFFCSPSLPFTSYEEGMLEFGFARQSLTTRVISGVQFGTAAQRAGLLNGSDIISASDHNLCSQDPACVYSMHLKKGEHVYEVEFKPRTVKKTIAWRI